MNPYYFRCSHCKNEYQIGQVEYICPSDGHNLDIEFDFNYLKKQIPTLHGLITKEQSMWRYLPLLPVEDPNYHQTPLRFVGWTPIYQSQVLCQRFNHNLLWIKDESRNPTASLKDRASALVVASASNRKMTRIITASTGNAGAALAGMAAVVGIKSVILAPMTAPKAKIAQLLIFGSEVILVDGTYDEAFDLSVKASEKYGWYCRNTGYNPYTVEGKKTAAFEIFEFMKNQISPVFGKLWNVVVPMGDGNIITGIHKGFKDLQSLGLLEKLPRLFGVQSEGSAAIANTIETGGEIIEPIVAQTLADSISVNFPRDGYRAIRAIKQTKGHSIKVSDREILDSMVELGNIGIFAEPAAASSLAGYKKLISQNHIYLNDPTILLVTGSGLKDIQAATKAVSEPAIIQPTLESLQKLVK